MRLEIIFLSGIGLAACSVAPAPDVTATPAVARAPFVVPMDPGQIKCEDLSNQTALSEATTWSLGRARAAVLSGRLSAVPTAETISQHLISHCGSNAQDTLAMAAAGYGA